MQQEVKRKFLGGHDFRAGAKGKVGEKPKAEKLACRLGRAGGEEPGAAQHCNSLPSRGHKPWLVGGLGYRLVFGTPLPCHRGAVLGDNTRRD